MMNLRIAHLNIRSLIAHFAEFRGLLLNSSFDIIGLSETWLCPSIRDEDINIPGYILIRKDRLSRGGGVCFYVRSNLRFSLITVDSTFEQLWMLVRICDYKIVVGVIYRPPAYSVWDFLDQLESSISTCLPMGGNFVCCGDFNIDLLDFESYKCKLFNNFLKDLGLLQIIRDATRVTRTSRTLVDLILTSEDSSACAAGVQSVGISDHELIHCTLSCPERSRNLSFTFRDFKNMPLDDFYADLCSSPLHQIFYTRNIDEKIEILNEILLGLLDVYAPVTIVHKHSRKHYAPWLTSNTRYLMGLRDKAFKDFKKTSSSAKWLYYKQLRNLCNTVVKAEKRAFFNYTFQNSNASHMWKELKKANIYNKIPNNIPEHLHNVNEMNTYFLNSVPRLATSTELNEFYVENMHPDLVCKLSQFNTVDPQKILTIIKSISSNAAGSDGLPISVIKVCCPHILPFICHIVNCCLAEGVFPNTWKTAMVTPIPKSSNITAYKDLRPISILPALSKILERIVEEQLRIHLEFNKILPTYQSGFRRGHSCLTALSRVVDDIVAAVDRCNVGVLVLLDYSRAFDTISHKLLLHILTYVGLEKTSLDFFKCYLEGRGQCTRLGGRVSDVSAVDMGVPQGSILGPILFCIYTSNIVNSLSVCRYQMYADDTQVYHTFPLSDLHLAISGINADLRSLADTSAAHSLILNPQKSSVMIFGNISPEVKETIKISINNSELLIQNEAKNLGVIFSSDLRFRNHVSKCVQRAWGALKMIYPHRSYLNIKTKLMLCESLVLSIFNYCAPLIYPCLDAVCRRRIQRIQNSCLRFVYGLSRYSRVSYKLRDAGWLNIENKFKLMSAVFFHRLILQQVPAYLTNRIRYRTDIHNINVRFRHHISIPVHRRAIFTRGFSYNICKVYNDVPLSLKQLSVSAFRTAYRKLLFG